MTTTQTSADLLTELVGALDSAFISTWQSTADWQQQLDRAKDHLKAERIRDAAPDLLAALEQMLDAFVDDPLTHQYTSGTAADAARAAIAKAKGEQQ